jgi:hypothetical protein
MMLCSQVRAQTRPDAQWQHKHQQDKQETPHAHIIALGPGEKP